MARSSVYLGNEHNGFNFDLCILPNTYYISATAASKSHNAPTKKGGTLLVISANDASVYQMYLEEGAYNIYFRSFSDGKWNNWGDNLTNAEQSEIIANITEISNTFSEDIQDLDERAVHKTGSETISGIKTFTNTTYFRGTNPVALCVSGMNGTAATGTNSKEIMFLPELGNNTLASIKYEAESNNREISISVKSPVEGASTDPDLIISRDSTGKSHVSTGVYNSSPALLDLVTYQFVRDYVTGTASGVVHITGTETITGDKTFTGSTTLGDTTVNGTLNVTGTGSTFTNDITISSTKVLESILNLTDVTGALQTKVASIENTIASIQEDIEDLTDSIATNTASIQALANRVSALEEAFTPSTEETV